LREVDVDALFQQDIDRGQVPILDRLHQPKIAVSSGKADHGQKRPQPPAHEACKSSRHPRPSIAKLRLEPTSVRRSRPGEASLQVTRIIRVFHNSAFGACWPSRDRPHASIGSGVSLAPDLRGPYTAGVETRAKLGRFY